MVAQRPKKLGAYFFENTRHFKKDLAPFRIFFGANFRGFWHVILPFFGA
ncbi:hypothetical protein [Porphyromonas loveana]